MEHAWVVADLHVEPGEKPSWGARKLPNLFVLGDTFDFLPYGMNAWRTPAGLYTIDATLATFPDETTVFVGNHEGRAGWLEEVVKGRFPVVRELLIDVNGTPWLLKHGHQYSEWWLLRHIADDIVEWATTNVVTKNAWYALCQRMGWMASGDPQPEKYNSFVAAMWGFALREANTRGVHVAFGHTHTNCSVDTDHFGFVNVGPREFVDLAVGIPSRNA